MFENYVQDITVEDQVVELSLWDTAGMSRLHHSKNSVITSLLRSGRVRQASVVVLRRNACSHDLFLCSSECLRYTTALMKPDQVDNPTSLENVESKVRSSPLCAVLATSLFNSGLTRY